METPRTEFADPFRDPVAEAARERFGIEYLYPWQRLVIANILDAVQAATAKREKDVGSGDSGDEKKDDDIDEDGESRGRQIVLLPTGAGKSLCFQIPALFFPQPTLVIFPLLALMADQERRLRSVGLDPVIFRGGQDEAERKKLFARLEGTDGKPGARIVIANPEVLASGPVLDRIVRRGIAHLAIDEAHCVSEWGDTFRPAYLDLARVIDRVKPLAVTAFTATASPAVLARTAEVLFAGRAHIVRGEADRPNIAYSVNLCHAKEAALVREVARRKRPIVIFCATRGGTERMAILLRETFKDEEIRFYHAGLSREEKTAVETWFHGHERAILTATCAWGLGIDKKNVRTVIHRDVPPSAEAYAQESGRAGRDGQSAEAVLLWSPRDVSRIGALPEVARMRAATLARFADGTRCRREVLLEALGDPRAGVAAADGERIACSGCDVCGGSASARARDGALVLSYIRRNRRCYSRDTIAENLVTTGNRVDRERVGYQVWKHTDFLGIIRDLENANEVRELDFWPWKGMMTVIRPQRLRPGILFRPGKIFLKPFYRKAPRFRLHPLLRRSPQEPLPGGREPASAGERACGT